MQEPHKQCTDFRHPLFGHNAAQKCLKSHSSFLHSIDVTAIPKTSDIRLKKWSKRLQNLLPGTNMGIEATEDLPPSHTAPRANWACLNRLRSELACTKTTLIKWGYTDNLVTNYANVALAHIQ
jgi:hypothetical protein